jgi:hypothetical protein
MKDLFHKEQESLVKISLEYPWENREAYATYLSQTYYYVRHSTRLLAASACRFEHKDESLHTRFLKHAREENAHDLLATRDLAALGYKQSECPELSVTKLVYQPQYYQIEHIDPICLFGYIFALEGVSALAAPKIYERVLKSHGKECTTFLKLHSTEDLDHIDKAFASIEGLDEFRMNLVRDNFKMSVEALKAYFTVLPQYSLKMNKAA